MSGIDLRNLPSHKILKDKNSQKFEEELNMLVRSGWQIMNMQTAQIWSEKRESYQYSYLAILIKQGLN